MSKIGRRNVLQLLGLAGAGYLASSIGRPLARAGGPSIPKRIVFFYTEQGTLKQSSADGTQKPFWAPTAAGAPDPFKMTAPWSTSDFSLCDMHQALVPWQKNLL